jgi:hypothetical protein
VCHTSWAAGRSRHTSTRRTTSWAAVLWQDARNSSVTSRTETTSLRLRRGGALFSSAAKALGVSTSRPPPKMEVTEIILAKFYRFCQVSSHSRRSFARVQIFKSIGPNLWISLAHKTLSYDTICFRRLSLIKKRDNFKISKN